MNCVAVIPARYASKRLPGKPLLKLGGKAMIQHVYERATSVPEIQEVLVATDDERILRCVEAFGGRACMTSSQHHSGSDRIAEAAAGLGCDWVFNVQGDEPFIDPETLRAVLAGARAEPSCPVYTAAAAIRSYEEWRDPSVVKVVTNRRGQALYFSRWPIPYLRDALADRPWEQTLLPEQLASPECSCRRHIGTYLYRSDFLQQFVRWRPGPLETAEKLEQLRILENGHTLAVVSVAEAPLSVDTQEDYDQAVRYFETVYDGR